MHGRLPSRLLFQLLICFLCEVLAAQLQPIAKFSFNDGKDYDEVSGDKARLVNVMHARDRFGNENHAVFIQGAKYSYLNLGTRKALKPREGTISLWLKQDGIIYSGLGARYTPILLTKQTKQNDFYESYALYYLPEIKKLVMVSTNDSLEETLVFSKEMDVLFNWVHVAMTYDDKSIAIYVNGDQTGKMRKDFPVKFLDGDSVMVGHTANKKNLRFMMGEVDDIEFYDRVLTADEVMELYKAPNPNRFIVVLKWVLVSLGTTGFIFALVLYVRYRIRKAVKVEKEKSAQANKILENELRVQRALMNPHFIFNSLNGLQDFILKKEFDGANDYLIKFSELLRKILESNMSDMICLELEIELLQRYIEVESLRFEENLDVHITVHQALIPLFTFIPIMMLQPFVENAIWHGLLRKEGVKEIKISFIPQPSGCITCTIEDNGIGRKDPEQHSNRKSFATQFIMQRLELLNKLHGLNCRLNIEDKVNGKGTIVEIMLPILQV